MTRTTLAAGLLTALACLTLDAQTRNLTADVPFEFHLGPSIMPAGQYAIQVGNGRLTFRTVEGQKKSACVLVIPKIRGAADTAGKLVFHRYGSVYFLSNVWAPGSADGQELQPTLVEKEYLARGGTTELAGVRLRRK